MQYMMMIYEDERVYGTSREDPARQDIMAKHMAFQRDAGAVLVGGAGLKDRASATTIRAGNGKQTVHDGPYAEAREQLGGFYIVDVPDLDAAIALAKKMPLHKDGSVEIRPVLTTGAKPVA
jgi:hypothetical protein